MEIDQSLLDSLFVKASANPRLRQSLDLRTSAADGSQRMLNALLPGTSVPVHRHPETSESVICLCGKIEEVFYEEISATADADDAGKRIMLREVKRIRLCPEEGRYGCQVPAGTWHTVEVAEPSVILEAKDGAYAPTKPEDIWAE